MSTEDSRGVLYGAEGWLFGICYLPEEKRWALVLREDKKHAVSRPLAYFISPEAADEGMKAMHTIHDLIKHGHMFDP